MGAMVERIGVIKKAREMAFIEKSGWWYRMYKEMCMLIPDKKPQRDRWGALLAIYTNPMIKM